MKNFLYIFMFISVVFIINFILSGPSRPLLPYWSSFFIIGFIIAFFNLFRSFNKNKTLAFTFIGVNLGCLGLCLYSFLITTGYEIYK